MVFTTGSVCVRERERERVSNNLLLLCLHSQNFSCVDTSVRNNNGELPEAACLKSAIKKLVCKQRVKQVGDK